MHVDNALYPNGKMMVLSESCELVSNVVQFHVPMWTFLELFWQTGNVPHPLEKMANVGQFFGQVRKLKQDHGQLP